MSTSALVSSADDLRTGAVPAGSREDLSFRLGGEEYAIEILCV